MGSRGREHFRNRWYGPRVVVPGLPGAQVLESELLLIAFMRKTILYGEGGIGKDPHIEQLDE